MALARARLATTRSDFAENKLYAMGCNTSGSTPAASTNQTASSFNKLSTLCFAGTRMRLNAMSTYQMFPLKSGKQAISSPSLHGNQLFRPAGGLLGVGRFKSSLLQVQSN